MMAVSNGKRPMAVGRLVGFIALKKREMADILLPDYLILLTMIK
jgi:hypothetical protein